MRTFCCQFICKLTTQSIETYFKINLILFSSYCHPIAMSIKKWADMDTFNTECSAYIFIVFIAHLPLWNCLDWKVHKIQVWKGRWPHFLVPKFSSHQSKGFWSTFFKYVHVIPAWTMPDFAWKLRTNKICITTQIIWFHSIRNTVPFNCDHPVETAAMDSRRLPFWPTNAREIIW